jgi:hypothetical protein
MTLQPTFQAARPSQYSWFESIPEIGKLASTIIDGLGVFGLAANGMCPTPFGNYAFATGEQSERRE